MCVCERASAGGKVKRIKTKQRKGRIKAGGKLGHVALCNLKVSVVCCIRETSSLCRFKP